MPPLTHNARVNYAAQDLLGCVPETARMMGGQEITGQYGSSTRQKQQIFGRVDPVCLVAVVPMLMVAGVFLWGGVAIAGVILIALALLVVLVDAWANRPIKKPAPSYREDC